MKLKKLITSLSLLLVLCVGCSAKNNTIHSDKLANEIYDLKNSINVQFDDINEEIIRPGFKLLANKGKIQVKYVEGEYDSLEVFLYDSNSESEDFIQLSEIDKLNGQIEFTNLTSATTYYIEFKCLGDAASSTLTLRFSQ